MLLCRAVPGRAGRVVPGAGQAVRGAWVWVGGMGWGGVGWGGVGWGGGLEPSAVRSVHQALLRAGETLGGFGDIGSAARAFRAAVHLQPLQPQSAVVQGDSPVGTSPTR